MKVFFPTSALDQITASLWASVCYEEVVHSIVVVKNLALVISTNWVWIMHLQLANPVNDLASLSDSFSYPRGEGNDAYCIK